MRFLRDARVFPDVLWKRGPFRNLWAASTVSHFGTTFGALSLTALVYLDASPRQMGVLAASSSVPVLLVAILAGVWVDRLPRIPVMIFADAGRFAALISVPVVAVSGELRVEQLYAVAFVTGCLGVAFSVAFSSTVPDVVPKERLVDANSALGMSDSVAASAGPAIGGGIVQAATAPVAMLVDALTFLVSGVFLARVRIPATRPAVKRRSAVVEALEGFRTAVEQPVLRAMLAMVATYS
ncbi:MAG: MFS transporter, partial [Dehalococcoidia bacterium]